VPIFCVSEEVAQSFLVLITTERTFSRGKRHSVLHWEQTYFHHPNHHPFSRPHLTTNETG
jgi:hypothetical protein